MKLFPQARDCLGVGALSHHVLYRITGSHIQQEEYHDHDAEKRRYGKDEPPYDEREQLSDHCCSWRLI